MGCNCGKKKKFVHIAKDGTETEVPTQSEALRLVREQGGRWQLKR